MNHGDVYVASVAVHSSYSRVLQALIEADKFNGPSVVLARGKLVAESSLWKVPWLVDYRFDHGLYQL